MAVPVALDLAGHGEWTQSRLDALLSESAGDLDWRRFEILDGALVVRPSAGRVHERLVVTLGHTIAAAAPEWAVGIAAAMIEVGRSYLVSDVTVVTAEAYASDPTALTRGDVLIVVEIESPSFVTTDRITKPAQYAQAGIAHYWRVETDPLRLVTSTLRDGAYVETGAWGADETAHITEPFPVSIDLATLLPR